MGVIILVFVLVVGFLYTNKNPLSRYRQKRSSGWDSYFHIAQWGIVFTLCGVIAVVSFGFLLNFLMWMLNIPALLPWFDYQIPSIGTYFLTYEIYDGLPSPIAVGVLLGAAMAYGMAKQEQDQLLHSYEDLLDVYGEVAKSDGLEELFFDSMKEGLLVLITLKSRKVYVGKVQQARFLHADLENVVIIPMLSGYRDKDDLTFREKHSYIEYYEENNISDSSTPHSIYHFRTVIPMREIESVSLFDAETYIRFESKSSTNGCEVLRKAND